MEMDQLAEADRESLKKLLRQRAGSPSELPDRAADISITLSEKLKSLDYNDLDHLFMQLFDSL